MCASKRKAAPLLDPSLLLITNERPSISPAVDASRRVPKFGGKRRADQQGQGDGSKQRGNTEGRAAGSSAHGRISQSRVIRCAENSGQRQLECEPVSKYLGVSWNRQMGSWEVVLPWMGSTICVGDYDCEEQAANAFIVLNNARILYLDFHRTLSKHPDLEERVLLPPAKRRR